MLCYFTANAEGVKVMNSLLASSLGLHQLRPLCSGEQAASFTVAAGCKVSLGGGWHWAAGTLRMLPSVQNEYKLSLLNRKDASSETGET